MSIIAKIFGTAAAEPVAAIGEALDGLFTSDDERLTHGEVMEKLRQAPGAAQAAINKVEAASRSLFVAGWRPWIGWVCGASLALYFIPQYALGAYVWIIACLQVLETQTLTADNLTAILPAYPVTAAGLMELVIALLGMGGLRTFEKLTGKAK